MYLPVQQWFQIIMPWKGLQNLGIGTWFVIHSENPALVIHTECHSRPECSYPKRRRDEWNVIHSWREGDWGAELGHHCGALCQSVLETEEDGQVKRERERERKRDEGDEDEGRHGYCGALRVLALYFWFFSAPRNCFFFFFFASAQTQVCSHSSLFLLNFLGVFVLFSSSFIFSFCDYLFFWSCQDC
jgi:hypothetical protein